MSFPIADTELHYDAGSNADVYHDSQITDDDIEALQNRRGKDLEYQNTGTADVEYQNNDNIVRSRDIGRIQKRSAEQVINKP